MRGILLVLACFSGAGVALASFPSGSFCVQTLSIYNSSLASLNELLASPQCAALQAQGLLAIDNLSSATQKLYVASGLASAFSGGTLRSHAATFKTRTPPKRNFWGRAQPEAVAGFSAYEVKLDATPEILFLNVLPETSNQAVRVAQILELVNYVLFESPRGTFLPLVITGNLPGPNNSLERSLLQKVLQLKDFGGNASGDSTFARSSADIELDSGAPLASGSDYKAEIRWALREPNLLDPNSDEAKARRALALSTLQEAAALLKEKNISAALADELVSRFTQDLPAHVDRALRQL